MNILISIFILFGFVTMVFLSPALMNVGLVRVSNKDYSISKSEFSYCCVPVLNHFYGWNKYSGSKISISGISSILMYSIIIIRYIVMVYFYNNESLQVGSIYAFLAVVIIYWIGNSINIYSVLKESGMYTFTSILFYSVAFIIGQIIIGYYMPRKMNYYSNSDKGDLYGGS